MINNQEESQWAIRDIRHGKTMFFKNFEELAKFVVQIMIDEQNKIVEDIKNGNPIQDA